MHQGLVTRWFAAAGFAIQSLLLGDFVMALAQVQDAVDIEAFERLARRLAARPESRVLLHTRPDLWAARAHMGRWRAGDPAIFGHQLARFYEGEATLDADIPDTPWAMSPDGRWSQLRWRQTHDVRHVLLGLGTTVHEELLLHAFQLGQHRTWMSVLLLLPAWVLGTLDGGNPLRVLRWVPKAFVAGLRAELVAGQRIEELLELPLEQVRRRLRITCIGSAYLGDGPFVPHRVTWVE